LIIRIKTNKNNEVFEKEVKCHAPVKIISKEDEIITISQSPICAFSQILNLLQKDYELEQFQKHFEIFHNSFFDSKAEKKEKEESEQVKNISNRLKLEIENSFKLLGEIRKVLKEKEELQKRLKEEEEEKRKLKLIIKLLYFGSLEESEEKELERFGFLKNKKIQISKVRI
jgi:hypothetical protein